MILWVNKFILMLSLSILPLNGINVINTFKPYYLKEEIVRRGPYLRWRTCLFKTKLISDKSLLRYWSISISSGNTTLFSRSKKFHTFIVRTISYSLRFNALNKPIKHFFKITYSSVMISNLNSRIHLTVLTQILGNQTSGLKSFLRLGRACNLKQTTWRWKRIQKWVSDLQETSLSDMIASKVLTLIVYPNWPNSLTMIQTMKSSESKMIAFTPHKLMRILINLPWRWESKFIPQKSLSVFPR